MSNIIPFRKPADQNAIQQLEEFLQQIKAGNVMQFILVAECKDTIQSDTYALRLKHMSKGSNFFMLVGMITEALNDLHDWNVGGRE